MKKIYKTISVLIMCACVSVCISGCLVDDVAKSIITGVMPDEDVVNTEQKKQDDIIIIEKEKETVKEQPKAEIVEKPVVKESVTPDNSDGVRYSSYYNDRFGYTVEYPDYFIPQTPAGNGGGLNFISPDGQFIMETWGSYYPSVMIENVTLDSYYEYSLDNLSYVPTYKAKKNNFFVFSGYMNGNTIYERHVLKSDGTENVVKMVYPAAREKEFDEIVSHISLNFKTGVGGDSIVEK